MAIYQKKPLEIEAYQWDGSEESTEFLVKWGKGRIRHRAAHDDGSWSIPEHMVVQTLEGNLRAAQGDWFIKGIVGEYYPVANEVFAASYKLIEA